MASGKTKHLKHNISPKTSRLCPIHTSISVNADFGNVIYHSLNSVDTELHNGHHRKTCTWQDSYFSEGSCADPDRFPVADGVCDQIDCPRIAAHQCCADQPRGQVLQRPDDPDDSGGEELLGSHVQ